MNSEDVSKRLHFIANVRKEFSFLEDWGFSFSQTQESRARYVMGQTIISVDRDPLDYEIVGSITNRSCDPGELDLSTAAVLLHLRRPSDLQMETRSGVQSTLRFYAKVVRALGEALVARGLGFEHLLTQARSRSAEQTRRVVAGEFDWGET